MADRTLEYVPVRDLRGHTDNPKHHDQALLAESMGRFGFTEPGLMDERTGLLVAGHGRLERLVEDEAAGREPPDGVRVDGDGRWWAPVVRGWSSVDDGEARAYLVTSNRLVETGGWLNASLAPLLDDLRRNAERGLDGVGFSNAEVDALLAGSGVNWNDRNKKAMPDARDIGAGEVWQVGNHRLVVGDSTDPDVWRALPAPGLVVTDPPYGIGYTGGMAEREVIDSDEDVEVAAAVLDKVAAHIVDRSTAGAATYIFLPGGPAFPVLLGVLHKHDLHRWSLVWAKSSPTVGRADFHSQHEHMSYAWTPGPRRVPVEDRTLTTLWQVPRPSRNVHHPTEKPVELLAKAILASSYPGDVVCDPFAGSGSTLVAAAQNDRVGTGIELRPEYARVALDRLAEVTGKKPRRVGR